MGNIDLLLKSSTIQDACLRLAPLKIEIFLKMNISDIEYFGKVNPKPFISLAKEEEIRIGEIKRRLMMGKSADLFLQEHKSEPELTYERDSLDAYE